MAVQSERPSNIHVDPIGGARDWSCFSASVVTLVVCLALTPAVQAAQIDISGPLGSGAFGTFVDVLPNGNIVVVDPSYTMPGIFEPSHVGAVYLYDPAGNLISTLTGSVANDQVGNNGILQVGSGNFVVLSHNWNSASASSAPKGAVTWINGTTGLSGMVSANNSLVGTTASSSVTALTNGNYVIASPGWNGNTGAATWGGGNAGVTGTISSGNSLVGDAGYQYVGTTVVALRNGNYVVASPGWNGYAGAATWGGGNAGVTGTISSGNSLVGTSATEHVGTTVVALSNGNYAVASPDWNFSYGAATWGDGTTGVKGTISSSNSLVGSRSLDQIGVGGITALSNGNYVVRSYAWNGNSGAATWGNGATGTTGITSPSNSLTGLVGDKVGYDPVIALSNGNYVVGISSWNGNTGAATWGSGTAGVTGTVSSSNSLVGAAPNDSVASAGIAALSNGNYVVLSPEWNSNMGAATWGIGSAGVTGTISSSNSLVGTAPNDYVGSGGIAALSNGNYVVASAGWNGSKGAATLCNGAVGTTGTISSSNSLIGSIANDQVGTYVIPLVENGNYVVGSPYWDGNVGAATWGSGIAGVVGTISSSNSLVGSAAGDQVGYGDTATFGNNYVVVSPYYGGVGAVTMASDTYRLSGQIQSWNTVIGAAANDVGLVPLAYDASRQRLVVGRPADNEISLFTIEQIFAANFEP